MIDEQPVAEDRRWSLGVRIVLDWSLPLDVLRPRYERAAELAVARRHEEPWVMPGMRDPFDL